MRTVMWRRPHAAGGSAVSLALVALVALALIALVLGALTGCVSAPAPTTTSAPSPSPSSTPRPTWVFSTDNQALVAATEAYAAYLAVSDEILSDGGIRPERLRAVATGAAVAQLTKDFSTYSERHWHTVGNTTFDSMRLQATSLRVRVG